MSFNVTVVNHCVGVSGATKINLEIDLCLTLCYTSIFTAYSLYLGGYYIICLSNVVTLYYYYYCLLCKTSYKEYIQAQIMNQQN